MLNSGSGTGSHPVRNWGNGLGSSSASLASMASMASLRSSSFSTTASMVGGPAEMRKFGPAFVFVVDGCIAEEDLRGLKNELLLVVEQLPETALVALITFDSMVKVHDLGFSECARIVLLNGERELSSDQVVDVKRICLNTGVQI